MKKLPLFFIMFLLSCAAPKATIVAPKTNFNSHPQPYHIFTIGKWNSDYVVLTLIDARNTYFSVRVANDPSFKKGAIYTP